VDDLRALLDHLGIGRADIVGLSMGGGIAVDFALAYPEAVRALIPVDSTLGGFRWSEAWEASYRPVAAKGRAGDIAGAKALWMAHAFFAPALEKPDVAARFRQMVSDYSGWHWNHRDPGRGVEPPACERLSEIRAPTLIVIGERDLPDLHRTAEALARGLPHARKVTLPGVGHMANLEAPEAFNRAALDFLAGL
jgi:pimeloyl-ACP methyl ester carboxylesterase